MAYVLFLVEVRGKERVFMVGRIDGAILANIDWPISC